MSKTGGFEKPRPKPPLLNQAAVMYDGMGNATDMQKYRQRLYKQNLNRKCNLRLNSNLDRKRNTL